MPGIVGLITKMPRDRAESELLQMVEALRHEPFYVAGTLVDETIGVCGGWVARKDSVCDTMPLRNGRGDVVMVFSGEDFSEPTAVHRHAAGAALATREPSYLVRSYEDSPAFPVGLNGKFHALVADRRKGTATLLNDRYGMRRLYYHEANGAFYFAAEAKAIWAVRPELRKIDPQGLGEFVACGCVLENRTLFEGVNVLPGGSAWVFRNGSIDEPRTYFQAREWEQQSLLEPEPFYQE